MVSNGRSAHWPEKRGTGRAMTVSLLRFGFSEMKLRGGVAVNRGRSLLDAPAKAEEVFGVDVRVPVARQVTLRRAEVEDQMCEGAANLDAVLVRDVAPPRRV